MNQRTQNQPASGATAQAPVVNAPRLEAGDRAITLLGWIATATAVVMYVSYLSQIQLNLAGHKGSAVQPLATMLNCSLWVAYGLLKRVRDWPVALANAPGVILGAVTFATAL
ncbi:SemiSWEET family transporter [uncultured Sphingomonas sp.]|uniref:SemiSWEET family transporter n=1 Tax=uncultured Sphingomonas sp. TaxID=158754 RepID=UPI0035C947C9